LSHGQLVSWSSDHTLRIWDAATAACLRVLKGHTGEIVGALSLPGGLLVAWGLGSTFWLWDATNEVCLREVGETEAATHYPKWLDARAEAWKRQDAVGAIIARPLGRTTHLLNENDPSYMDSWRAASLASWHAEWESAAGCLLFPDGTVVVDQYDGQVCILKLYHGQRRVSIAEAEQLLSIHHRQQV